MTPSYPVLGPNGDVSWDALPGKNLPNGESRPKSSPSPKAAKKKPQGDDQADQADRGRMRWPAERTSPPPREGHVGSAGRSSSGLLMDACLKGSSPPMERESDRGCPAASSSLNTRNAVAFRRDDATSRPAFPKKIEKNRDGSVVVDATPWGYLCFLVSCLLLACLEACFRLVKKENDF